MPPPLPVTFVAGDVGPWRILRNAPYKGDGLPVAERLLVLEGSQSRPPPAAAWTLSGTTSNGRYINHGEQDALRARQAGLGRPEARLAALIPIRKTDRWWDMPQDERRAVFEERSHHIGIGMEYISAVARRLYHCRDLGGPFDFLTWFEYPPEAAEAFEEMVARLRATEEWDYVDLELDIRLIRET
ncbi:hypothetical protein DFJ74DRAFT_417122 [Hyaloraphidium curvatum]|nr:hypothetical protein DFJ74DRAFT_417122 [Hyaloraphidium curvatum]